MAYVETFIPAYPTMAFATRADHEAWIRAQEAQEAQEPEQVQVTQVPVVYLTKEDLKQLNLTADQVNGLYELFVDQPIAGLEIGQKKAALRKQANTSLEAYETFLGLVKANKE
jgi:hypothetical protein